MGVGSHVHSEAKDIVVRESCEWRTLSRRWAWQRLRLTPHQAALRRQEGTTQGPLCHRQGLPAAPSARPALPGTHHWGRPFLLSHLLSVTLKKVFSFFLLLIPMPPG